MSEKAWYEEPIESVVIVRFMIEFDKFEKEIKRIFQEQINLVEHRHKSLLYFYYGCTVGNEWRINFDDRCIERAGIRKYNDAELFKSLTLDKINKFLRKERIIQCFNLTINSLQTNMSEYPFYDCCEKLIKMRNCLAHSISQVTFKNSEIIELLNDQKIEKYASEYYNWDISVHNLTETSKIICSNLIYIKVLIQELNSKIQPILINDQ